MHDGGRCAAWARETFGAEFAGDVQERGARVLEEAAELAQASDVGEAMALRILLRAFSRPVGTRAQEAGGLMVTLFSWAAATGIDLGSVAREEVSRVERPEVREQIRAKQFQKAEAGVGRKP